MGLTVQMQTRSFQEVAEPAIRLEAQSLTWADPGGPESARLVGAGNRYELAETLNWLRRPVVVHRNGTPFWWGYVHEVTVRSGGYGVWVSLDSLVNRVAVAYSYVEPGTAEVGERRTTEWNGHAESVGIYGYKELLHSVDGASTAQAEAVRDLMLSQQKWPAAFVSQEQSQDAGTVEILCRGWWSTLGWRYYANSGTDAVAATTRMAAIVASAGQFLAGSDMEWPIATTASEYADGESLAVNIIEDLLRPGLYDEPVLCTVTVDRVLKVCRRPPTYQVDLRLAEDGRLLTTLGQPVEASPVGKWCDVDLPLLGLLNYVHSPAPFLIQRAEYDVTRNAWQVQPWGAPSPWELLRIEQG